MFALLFFVQGGSRVFSLSTASPNLVVDWVHLRRLLAILLVIAAVLRKNLRPQ